MLYRFQKEVLVLLFVFLTVYPAFRLYSHYKHSIKKIVKKTTTISQGIIKDMESDTLSDKEEQDTFKFDLNEVSWEALTLIPGVGEHTAKKVITYRMKNGRFKRVKDILKIKGIGKSTFEKIKPYVYVK